MQRAKPENEVAHRFSRLIKFGNRLVNYTPRYERFMKHLLAIIKVATCWVAEIY